MVKDQELECMKMDSVDHFVEVCKEEMVNLKEEMAVSTETKSETDSDYGTSIDRERFPNQYGFHVVDNEQLIHVVRETPVLWDNTLPTYKDRYATKTAWYEVCSQLTNGFNNLDDKEKSEFFANVLKRWRNLRDSFVRAERRMKASKANGSQMSKQRKYIFSKELQFLRKVYTERETEESFNNEANVIEEASDPLRMPEVSTEKVVTEESAPKKTSLKWQQHQKMDEIDLKIFESLKKEPEEENRKLKFFESLLPHVAKFDDSQWLQYQTESLQLISKIKNAS